MEKWQEALEQWHEWTESVLEARSNAVKEHGNLAELIGQARIDYEEVKGGAGLRLRLNREMKIVWDIDEELLKQGRRFVSKEVGLGPGSFLHRVFVDYWMQCVFPEFGYGEDIDMNYYEEREDVPDRIWGEYKIVDAGKADEDIEYIVHWYQSKLKPKEVAEKILRAKWPSNQKDLPKRSKGGRYRNPQIPLQAVVCFLLKNKEMMAHKEIADLFGWKTYEDSNGNLMSNTVRSRIKLGAHMFGREKE